MPEVQSEISLYLIKLCHDPLMKSPVQKIRGVTPKGMYLILEKISSVCKLNNIKVFMQLHFGKTKVPCNYNKLLTTEKLTNIDFKNLCKKV